jgi:hypothetical protein
VWTGERGIGAAAGFGAIGPFLSAADVPEFCPVDPQLINSMPIPNSRLWQFCRGSDDMDNIPNRVP